MVLSLRSLDELLITISGPAGSGKSHCASKLAELYGIPCHSVGSIFRRMASERGLSVEEFSKVVEKDPTIDRELDRRTAELASKGGQIIEGRLVSFFSQSFPNTLSFYLTAPFEERVKRIALREGISIDAAEVRTKMREESEKQRYKSLYNIDIDDLSVYDFVINTSKWDKESVVLLLKEIIDLYLKTSSKE
ncbi:MAG: AAA family ATPase [Candidatus Methanomethyliaceae archaeon]|nr:AAA family ATPase [Candidatus Methanomethyliaceae archaeon]